MHLSCDWWCTSKDVFIFVLKHVSPSILGWKLGGDISVIEKKEKRFIKCRTYQVIVKHLPIVQKHRTFYSLLYNLEKILSKNSPQNWFHLFDIFVRTWKRYTSCFYFLILIKTTSSASIKSVKSTLLILTDCLTHRTEGCTIPVAPSFENYLVLRLNELPHHLLPMAAWPTIGDPTVIGLEQS